MILIVIHLGHTFLSFMLRILRNIAGEWIL